MVEIVNRELIAPTALHVYSSGQEEEQVVEDRAELERIPDINQEILDNDHPDCFRCRLILLIMPIRILLSLDIRQFYTINN